jgi:hypothetical protein
MATPRSAAPSPRRKQSAGLGPPGRTRGPSPEVPSFDELSTLGVRRAAGASAVQALSMAGMFGTFFLGIDA